MKNADPQETTFKKMVIDHLIERQRHIYHNIKNAAMSGLLQYDYDIVFYEYSFPTHLAVWDCIDSWNLTMQQLDSLDFMNSCHVCVKLETTNLVSVRFNFEKMLFLPENRGYRTNEITKIISYTDVYKKACCRAEAIFIDVITKKIPVQMKSHMSYEFIIYCFVDSLLLHTDVYIAITLAKLKKLFNEYNKTSNNRATCEVVWGVNNDLRIIARKNLGVF